MIRTSVFLLTAAIVLCTPGCVDKVETPLQVLEEYQELITSLDPDRIGDSIERLESFRDRHRRYVIMRSAEKEIEALGRQVPDRYHLARELARDGDYERAETILLDLTKHFAQSPDGRNAAEYLKFEFHFSMAQQLLMARRPDLAELVARQLASRRLTAIQTQQLERLLDSITTTIRAQGQADQARAQSASRQIQVLLAQRYVEYDSYPEELTLETLDLLNRDRADRIRSDLSAIEGYQTSGRGFSMTTVSRNGGYRFLVTEKGVEPQ